MVLSIENVISEDEGITQPDVFRLDLPSYLVSTKASQFAGPPFGREIPTAPILVAENEADQVQEEPVEALNAAASGMVITPNPNASAGSGTVTVTDTTFR